MAINHKIDFVIPWLDDSDPEWQKDFAKYCKEDSNTDKRECRYRDWDLLKYWFRGVEKFAPWVNKIHFITCGHIPEWLNLDHPKLNWVKHSDYIPEEWLPTFSANPIELNIHRIKGLEEHFVYFNDDCFLIDKVEPKQFFKKGLPCDMAVANINYMIGDILFNNIVHNDIRLINANFRKNECIWKHFLKWMNPKYGALVLRTIVLLPWYIFPGFIDPHLPCPLLKSTFDEVWGGHNTPLVKASMSKFRSITDVNFWLMRYWQLVSGRFHPYNVYKKGIYYDITDGTIGQIENEILSHMKSIIVLNDSSNISVFGELKQRLQNAFEQILPEKSMFEL